MSIRKAKKIWKKTMAFIDYVFQNSDYDICEINLKDKKNYITFKKSIDNE